jgi:DNA-binding NarL/FixJ family response regulator
MTRVLIAAPTPALRAGLRALLASADIQIAGEAATLAALDTDLSAVDVILVGDVELLEDAARTIGDAARVAVLALADDSRVAELLRTLPLIGWGILPPDASPAGLRAAVHTVAQGLVVLPAPLIEQLLGQRGPLAALAPSAEPLTAREREVFGASQPGTLEQADRARAAGQRAHRQISHLVDLCQAGRGEPHRGDQPRR